MHCVPGPRTHPTPCCLPPALRRVTCLVVSSDQVVTVKTMDNGDIDFGDLTEKAQKHSKDLAALMVTYPSTYGVFEEGIVDI